MNPGHTGWHDEITLTQLLNRHGFTVVELAYVGHRTPSRVPRCSHGTLRALPPHRLAENTLLVVATPAG